jgi:hypothetical protein
MLATASTSDIRRDWRIAPLAARGGRAEARPSAPGLSSTTGAPHELDAPQERARHCLAKAQGPARALMS